MNCGICRRNERGKIDAALLLGKTIRAVASEYRVSKSVLHRHLKKHCRYAAERAIARTSLAYSRDLRGYMRQVQEMTLQVMRSAQADGDKATALLAGKEVRENCKVMARLLGKSPESNQTKANGKQPMRDVELVYEEAQHANLAQ